MNKTMECVLGIDTSNYKTSVAAVDETGSILCDIRRLLRVKQGERGLRQSDALFQHIENLPELLQEAFVKCKISQRIRAVAVSSRPRPIENSYMPVFKAGIGFGRSVAAALQVPFFEFSHQEGHIEAVRYYSRFCCKTHFLAYHLSGGTCEFLEVTPENIRIIGGSRDLSVGQAIDRVGVKLGMSFPAGEEMDKRALAAKEASNALKRIPGDGLFFNLSGLETQCSRQAERLFLQKASGQEMDALIRELFDKITRILVQVTEYAVKETGLTDILFTGGVASSRYIGSKIKKHFEHTPVSIEFGNTKLSQDNAVGIALLGGKKIWQ